MSVSDGNPNGLAGKEPAPCLRGDVEESTRNRAAVGRLRSDDRTHAASTEQILAVLEDVRQDQIR